MHSHKMCPAASGSLPLPKWPKALPLPAQEESSKSQDPEYHIKIGFQGRFCPFFAASVAVSWAKAMLGREAQGDQTNRCHFCVAEGNSLHKLRPDETDKNEKLTLDDQSQLSSLCLSSAVAWQHPAATDHKGMRKKRDLILHPRPFSVFRAFLCWDNLRVSTLCSVPKLPKGWKISLTN